MNDFRDFKERGCWDNRGGNLNRWGNQLHGCWDNRSNQCRNVCCICCCWPCKCRRW